MTSAGTASPTELFRGVEMITFQFGDPEVLMALKPRAPSLSDREWLLLAGRFGVKEAYLHCFVEYWKQRGGKNKEQLFIQWVEEASPDPSYAPIEVFIS
jgi:hypothetical protein